MSKPCVRHVQMINKIRLFTLSCWTLLLDDADEEESGAIITSILNVLACKMETRVYTMCCADGRCNGRVRGGWIE